jgi:hypothetical protein
MAVVWDPPKPYSIEVSEEKSSVTALRKEEVITDIH